MLSHLAAAWVACEEVSPLNGGLFYYPGSHRIPEFDWGERQISYDATKEKALVHGGSPPLDRARTRRSFVSHYSTLSAYPRDRRALDRDPVTFELNGARLYLMTSA